MAPQLCGPLAFFKLIFEFTIKVYLKNNKYIRYFICDAKVN